MAYIAQYTTDVVHTPGTSNLVANLLSLPPPPPKTPLICTGKIQVLGELGQASTQQNPQKAPSTTGKLLVFAAVAATPAATSPINHQVMALRQILCQEAQQLRASPALQVISRPEGDL